MKKRLLSKAAFAICAIALLVSLLCVSGITFAAEENTDAAVLTPDNSNRILFRSGRKR